MAEPLEALDQVRMTAIDLAMKFGPKVLVAVAIVVAGYFAGQWAGRATLRLLARLQLEPPVRQLVERMVRIFVLALFGIVALQNLGVELLPLIAGLGVAGAAVALAMQGVLSNIAAGLTIIFTRPFRVGDYISINKEEGEVLDISLFNTILGHPDLSRVVIPNRRIVGEILHNFGRIRQLELEVALALDADLPGALGAIDEALKANARVLRDPAHLVRVTRLADARIAVLVGPWVNVPDYGPAIGEVNQAVLAALRGRNIAIAAPQREVRTLPPGA